MRVLRNAHRNFAIEISRKEKWSILVLGWTPTYRLRITNSDVDLEWEEYTEIPIKDAILKFLNPILESSSIEATAERELRKLLLEVSHEK